MTTGRGWTSSSVSVPLQKNSSELTLTLIEHKLTRIDFSLATTTTPRIARHVGMSQISDALPECFSCLPLPPSPCMTVIMRRGYMNPCSGDAYQHLCRENTRDACHSVVYIPLIGCGGIAHRLLCYHHHGCVLYSELPCLCAHHGRTL